MGLEIIETKDEWNEIVRKHNINDIYYSYEYCNSSAQLEKGSAKLFYYHTNLGATIYPVIIREIESSSCNTLYDMITPYGYGGPLVIGNTIMLEDFRREFSFFCEKENVITEIIRFHPLLKNAQSMKKHCDLQFIRKTTAVNLTENLEMIRSEYTKMNRRNIKKARKSGLVCKEVSKNSENTSTFMKLYKETMNRKNASDFYYFSFEFIEEQLKETPMSASHLLFVYYGEKVISAIILFTTASFSHYYLGASQIEYLYLRPNNLIFDYMVEVSKEKGCTYLHLGGGYIDNDKLFKYKSSFANNNNYDYYIGKKVFDRETSNFLVEANKTINYQESFSSNIEELILVKVTEIKQRRNRRKKDSLRSNCLSSLVFLP